MFRTDAGELARPSSEVRLLHDEHSIFLALYAGGREHRVERWVRRRDRRVRGPRRSARHARAAAAAGVFAAVDFDEGPLDDPRDDDEEWVVELAVPLTLAVPPPLAVHVARCDTPKDAVERCGVWAARVAVE